MALQFNLLGRFELMREGVRVEQWPRAGAQRLIKLLAVEPRHCLPVERAVSLLWPQESGERLEQRLHNLVYLARSALGPAGIARAETTPHDQEGYAKWIRVKDRVVSLQGGDSLWIDTDEFERRLDTALPDPSATLQLELALELYRGPLLPNDEGEEWLAQPRLHLEQRYLNGLHALAERYEQSGNLEGAISVLQRALKTAPADETAHQALIRLFGRVGRLADVERQHAQCKATLTRELGVMPSEKTRATYREAMRNLGMPTRTASENGGVHNSDVTCTSPLFRPPAPLVTLIGRDALVKDISTQLVAGNTRLLTLVGVGGVGKTQLANRVANVVLHEYRDGVCFVSLAETASDGIIDRIRRAARLSSANASADDFSMLDPLREMHLLLVLDNFEHVLDRADLLPQLLQQCPQLTVLVTSRIRLNVVPERVVLVPPLEVNAAATTGKGRLSPAGALFAERAAAAAGHFTLDDTAALDVAAIVKQLGGLPLAIELVAARAAVLDLPEMRRSLDASLELAASGGVDRPRRQRSLMESLAWSCGLLSTSEQDVLYRLALFPAGFETATALAVCRDVSGDGLQALQKLIDLGLVARKSVAHAEKTHRFQVPEAIRPLIHQRFCSLTGPDDPIRRFCEVLADLAVQLDQAVTPENSSGSVARFKDEYENFLDAMRLADAIDAPELMCRLVQGLARFWADDGVATRTRPWVERALEHADRLPVRDRGLLMVSAGVYLSDHADTISVVRAAKEAIRCAEECGDHRLLVRATLLASVAFINAGQLDMAVFVLQRAEPHLHRLNDADLSLSVRSNLATCHWHMGEIQRAGQYWRECERTLGNVRAQQRSYLTQNLALLDLFTGNLDGALQQTDRALAFERQGALRPTVISGLLIGRAWIALCCHRLKLAEKSWQEAADLLGRVDRARSQRWLTDLQGKLALAHGDAELSVATLRHLELAAADDEISIRLDRRIWLAWASLLLQALDLDGAAHWIALALDDRHSARQFEARLLDISAAFFFARGEQALALRACKQAADSRRTSATKRFPIEQSFLERVVHDFSPEVVELSEAPINVQLDSADPLGWLVHVVRSPAAVSAQAASGPES